MNALKTTDISKNNEAVLITNSEYEKLSNLLEKKTGIQLPLSKKIMLMVRLNKRLKSLGINNYDSYYNYLMTIEGDQIELENAINAISTNKTLFFREDQQFGYLEKKVIPLFLNKRELMNKKLNIWSAGCSSGEEPYTLAMILENSNYINNDILYSIMATDISTKVLEKAKKAIYHKKDINAIPLEFQKKYLLRGKYKYDGLYSIVPEVKKNITFKKHNLMDQTFYNMGKMDIIFCRNVIIYFNKEIQHELIEKFYSVLRPGGFLFIGASETFFEVDNLFRQVGPSIYQKL